MASRSAGLRVLAGRRGRDRRDRVYHGPHASLLDIGEFARVGDRLKESRIGSWGRILIIEAED